MRELKNFKKSFDSKWAGELKQLFKNSNDYKKNNNINYYSKSNAKTKEFKRHLSELLAKKIEERPKKKSAFLKRLIKNRDAILTFLYFKDVPPNNNGSERVIRNVKVKMKISNQFKSIEFAQNYAVIRSVIDTTIKNSRNVFEALTNLSNLDSTPAE